MTIVTETIDAPDYLDTPYHLGTDLGDMFEGYIDNSLGDGFDRDWISIDLTVGQEYVIDVETMYPELSLEGFVLNMYLFDSNGQELNDGAYSSISTAPMSHTITFTPFVTDTYYIEVSEYTLETNAYNHYYTVSAALVPSEVINTVDGTDGNDHINGSYVDMDGNSVSAGDDVVYGGAGDDYISSGRGNDVVYGGAGNDLIYSGHGSDIVHGGDGDDEIHGQKQHNTLLGDAGNDTIYTGKHGSIADGGIGDDTIYAHMGKRGGHTLTGGEGSDTFIFSNASTRHAANATITDFDYEIDVLIITGIEVDVYGLAYGEDDSFDAEYTDEGLLVHYGDNDSILIVDGFIPS